MVLQNTSFTDLDQLLHHTPVLANVHPLIPVCLSPDIRVIRKPNELLAQVDDVENLSDQPALVLQDDPVLRERFPLVHSLEHPPIATINEHMKHHIDYIREHFLTTDRVGDHIATDVAQNQYELVTVLLLDGLSYGDVLNWGGEVQPCFVDGPSVTFRKSEDETDVIHDIGFASIIGNPSIAEKLYQLGYRNACGYTYWEARDNLLARYMFRGISDNQVVNFEGILELVEEAPLGPRTYLQIVREGLDGLAHSKRELRTTEIQGALRAIRDDIERLIEILRTKALRSVIYITADHGILWKNEHNWELLPLNGSRPRYTYERPENSLLDYVVRMERGGRPVYLLTYPYLGTPIRKNDSGVHGGFSYQESFVPFIKIEV